LRDREDPADEHANKDSDDKKSFEEGVEINSQMYYKKSDPHKAAVVGDTVGDPFKDTSGPSLNILLKLMSVVISLILIFVSNYFLSNFLF
jgi:Na+/H+-translocating membrane pyrophosphatase